VRRAQDHRSTPRTAQQPTLARRGLRWAALASIGVLGLLLGFSGVAGAVTTTSSGGTSGSASTSPVPPSVTVVSGALQSAKVGTAFAAPLTVSVTCEGTPVQGATVVFSAPGSGPSAVFLATQATIEETTSGPSGTASSSELAANDVVGSYDVTVTATVPSSPSTDCASGQGSTALPLSNTAGTPSTVVEVSGSGQSTAVGTTFPDPLVVEVTDQYGNPVSGAAVNFVVEADDGAGASFATGGSSATVATDADGQATSPALTAGTTAGSFIVVADVSGASEPAVFSLEDLPGPPATLTAGVGDDQQAELGQPFAIPLAVTVRDADGNPVPGVSVTFSAPTSGASGTFAGGGTSVTVMTDSDGVAVAPTFTANDQPGGFVVEASVAQVSQPAVFALVNEEPPPAPPSPPSNLTSAVAPPSSGPGTGIVGMVVDPVTGGYWLVGANGAVFSFDAPYLGGANTVPGGPGAPVVGAGVVPSGQGYWEVTSAGAVFSFGQAPYLGGANTL
jgi:protocatechuate 3,4-dioxygenase beta subunit